METKTILRIIYEKFNYYIKSNLESSTFEKIFTNFILISCSLLTGIIITYPKAGAEAMQNIILYQNGLIRKTFFCFLAYYNVGNLLKAPKWLKKVADVFEFETEVSQMANNTDRTTNDFKNALNQDKKTVDQRLINHLISNGTFRRNEITEHFDFSRSEFENLKKRFLEIGILTRGQNNSIIFNQETKIEVLEKIYNCPIDEIPDLSILQKISDNLQPIAEQTENQTTC